MSKLKKTDIKEILVVFDQYYCKLEKKPLLIFVFKHFRYLTYCILKLYVKNKKLLYAN